MRAQVCESEGGLKHCKGQAVGWEALFQNKDRSSFWYRLEFRSSEFPLQDLGLFPKNSTETTIVLIFGKIKFDNKIRTIVDSVLFFRNRPKPTGISTSGFRSISKEQYRNYNCPYLLKN